MRTLLLVILLIIVNPVLAADRIECGSAILKIAHSIDALENADSKMTDMEFVKAIHRNDVETPAATETFTIKSEKTKRTYIFNVRNWGLKDNRQCALIDVSSDLMQF